MPAPTAWFAPVGVSTQTPPVLGCFGPHLGNNTERRCPAHGYSLLAPAGRRGTRQKQRPSDCPGRYSLMCSIAGFTVAEISPLSTPTAQPHPGSARKPRQSWPRWMRASKSSTEPERSSGTRSNVHTTHSRSAPSTAASSPRMRPLRHPAGDPRVQSRRHEVKDATSMLARVGDLLAEQAHRRASQNARQQDREHLSPAAGTGRTEPRRRPRPRSST
jgi:hypothetical protein